MAIFVPVLKEFAMSSLNNYNLAELNPDLLKGFEQLVLQHTKNNIPESVDPLQFASRTNRSTEYAVSFAST